MLNSIVGLLNGGGAAGGGSSFESIASTTLASDTSSYTFSSIPQTYQHLQLRFITRNAAAATGFGDFRLTVNGASSSYAWHKLSGDGSTAAASALTADKP